MAVTDGDVQGVALRLGAIAGAHQSQRLLVALGHAGHHVGDQGAVQAVESTILLLIVRAGDVHLVALNLDGDVLVDRLLQLALRALHDDMVVVGNGDRDAGRNCNRMSSDTRHCFYLRFSVVDYQM